MTEKNLEKIRNFPHNIKVIGKEEIKKYTSYVEETYGKNFVNLYGE